MKKAPTYWDTRFATEEAGIAWLNARNLYSCEGMIPPILMEMKHGHEVYRVNPDHKAAPVQLELWGAHGSDYAYYRLTRRSDDAVLGVLPLYIGKVGGDAKHQPTFCHACLRIQFDGGACSSCGGQTR